MKNILKMTFLLVFLYAINIHAQNSVTKSEIKTTLTKLFDLCKTKNYAEASAYFAYEGKDAAGNRKVSFNYAEKSEKKAVKRKCKKIKAYLDLSDSYEYGDFNSSDSKAEMNVIFKSGDQELKITFSFTKAENKILLTDFK